MIEGAVLDLSALGFRAAHHYRALATGQIVAYKHNRASGRATVMWTSIVGDQVQSGFRYLPD